MDMIQEQMKKGTYGAWSVSDVTRDIDHVLYKWLVNHELSNYSVLDSFFIVILDFIL